MWTANVETFNDVSVKRDNTSLTITGLPQDEKCSVLIYDTDGVVKMFDSAGNVKVSFDCVSPNSAVTLIGNNRVSRLGDLVLQNETVTHDCYVFANSATIGFNKDKKRTEGDFVIKNSSYTLDVFGDIKIIDGLVVDGGSLTLITPCNVNIAGIKIINGGHLIIKCGNPNLQKDIYVDDSSFLTIKNYDL